MGARRRRLNTALVAGQEPDADYFDEPAQRKAPHRGRAAAALAVDGALGRSVALVLCALLCASAVLLAVHRALTA